MNMICGFYEIWQNRYHWVWQLSELSTKGQEIR